MAYHHGNLREALIRAGLDILAEQGFEAMTLRGCASRVGVSHAAPKNHFESLEALQAAIVAEGFRRLHDAMRERMIRARGDQRGQLVAAVEGYGAFAAENPALFRLMFATPRWSTLYPELREAADAAYGVLRDICAGVRHENAGGPAPRTTVEAMVWSYVHGYCALLVNDRFGRATDETGRVPTIAEALPRFTFADGS